MDGYEEYIRSAKEWKSAVDPKSGRTYYYNTRTKETTWTKPLELASPEERREMIQKRNDTLQFFRDMEYNIKMKIEKAREEEENQKLLDYYYDDDKDGGDNLLFMDEKEERELQRVRFNSASSFDGKNGGRSRVNSVSGAPPRRVRTISTMDDEILMTLRQSNGGGYRGRSNYIAEEKSYRSNDYHAQAKHESKAHYADDSKSTPSSSSSSGTAKKRRNSTGTIYVTNTMSIQDNTATIHCVCAVIRAHMVSAARENIVPLPEYDIFKDIAITNRHAEVKENNPMALVPSLQTVKDFFTYIFSKSQLESDCIIMALIYCERLVKETKGRLCIRYDNWRSIVFACLVMASKVWDDLSMWNVDFSQVYSNFDLARINSLELAMLEALKYVIRVSASEYAKYYFLLRSMIVRLGLHSSDSNGGSTPSGGHPAHGQPNLFRPLDLAGARKLQLSTERYQELSVPTRRRHNSMHEGGSTKMAVPGPPTLERNYSDGYPLLQQHTVPVSLEHLIHDEHVDADGQAHVHASLKKKASSHSMKVSPSKRAQDKASF